MKRKSEHYIEDILIAIIKIKSFVKDMTLDVFPRDDKTQFAVTRAFEIIGEATKKISDDIKMKNPDIPWRDIAGMRDILAHEYIDVDLKTI